ncbi:hypothetical protein NBRC116601_08860 [Cognatishimia sp. WU-CL00825]|uniref:PAS domain-containing protein n=1 Tax=Cognatishimia sp. WU-CL00825 TaxID=3127658 RepID=UPI003109121A
MTQYFDHDQPSRASRFPALAEVETYWEGLRGRAEVPKRAQIDPRGIQTALPYAFILEKVTPRIARFRLAGSKICQAFGAEARGMPATCLITPDRRDFFENTLQDVFAMPARARLNFTWGHASDHQIDAQMLILPLHDDIGRVTRALGCLQFAPAKSVLARHLYPNGSLVKPVGAFGHLDPGSVRNHSLVLVASNDAKPTPSGHRKSLAKTQNHLHLV